MKSLINAIAFSLVMGTTLANAAQINPEMETEKGRPALLITDPQVDFPGAEGVTWVVHGTVVTGNNAGETIESLLKSAEDNGVPVFISSRHYVSYNRRGNIEGTNTDQLTQQRPHER